MICLEPLDYNIALLSCNHKFHFNCIKNWINTKKKLKNICILCETETEIINIYHEKEPLNNHQPFIEEEEQKSTFFSCCTIL